MVKQVENIPVLFVYHKWINRESFVKYVWDIIVFIMNQETLSECDGWVCVFEVIGSPSVFKLTRRTTVMLVRVFPTFSFRVTENGMYGCRCNQRLKAIINN